MELMVPVGVDMAKRERTHTALLFLYVWQRKELARLHVHGFECSERSTPTPPGNSDGYQNKGDAKKAIRKNMKTRAIKIDGSRKTHWVGGEGRDETGTLSAEPWVRDYRIRYYLSSEKLKVLV